VALRNLFRFELVMSGSIQPAIERERLVRCLGMMGSSCDGEALNAARIADRHLRAAGLTWADVIRPEPAPSPQLPPPPPQPTRRPPAPPPQRHNVEPQPAPRVYSFIPRNWPTHWRWLICAILDSREFVYLHPADKRFLRAAAVYRSPPSYDQLLVLRAIADRVLVTTAAAA
jgi:hypothetical protein